MKIQNKHYQSIWYDNDSDKIFYIDQTKLPFQFEILELKSHADACRAIRNMEVRGAPLIGATAAWGMFLAIKENNHQNDFTERVTQAAQELYATRPTAVDLYRAANLLYQECFEFSVRQRVYESWLLASRYAEESISMCRNIGEHGLEIIKKIARRKKGKTINILTHCNAGWLATVDYGTATAPIYLAAEAGIPIHVWVDETRPRNQGASLTAFELGEAGIEHTLIADNTGGYLMQLDLVDMVIVGTDRVAMNGDVANKIGTYLKALAANDNHVPFYVAAPSSSIDFAISNGMEEIEIEERSPDEVRFVYGLGKNGPEKVRICPESTPALNIGFDVTPAKYITGLITERGICQASHQEILKTFPEYDV